MKSLWQILIVLLVAVISLGKSPPTQESKAVEMIDLARGQRLFVGHCALCHGIGGAGDRGPALNQPKLRRAVDDQALFFIIKTGIPGTEMPDAWQMTDREIRQVAAYVRSLGQTAPTKLSGNPANGKALYESKGGCATCHIVQGRGRSFGPELTEIGARRSAAYLRQALLDPGASSPESLLVVSVVTREGRRLRGNRANEDSFTIQLRDATGGFHSYRKADLAELKKETGKSLMPSYRDALNSSEIDDLVAYLAGLRGEK